MNYGEFKKFVAAFLQRAEASFVDGNVDLLAVAIEQARKTLERMKDFEMARTPAILTMPTDGQLVALTDAKLTDGSPVDIKNILQAFLPTDGGDLIPARVFGRDTHVEQVRRMLGSARASDRADRYADAVGGMVAVIRFGLSAYLAPASSEAFGSATTLDVRLDVTRWLPSYSNDTDTDFLLTYCVDLMLMQVIKWLNLAMREDARIPVSAEGFAAAWRAMEDWNRTIAMSNSEAIAM